MAEELKVLALQPFDGGSHKAFLDGWIENSRHEWTVISLPDQFWRRRMHFAAVEFAARLQHSENANSTWDVMFTTDLMNLAEFRSLAPASVSRLPMLLYFHENQFEYPNQPGRERNQDFGFVNLKSVLSADQTWFNSEFNCTTFLKGAETTIKQFFESELKEEMETARSNFRIQSPGIDVSQMLPVESLGPIRKAPLHILWAARWDHDKNPEDLLATLEILREEDFPFQLSVLGQRMGVVPEAITKIQESFADQIINFGYQPSRRDYLNVLESVDVVVSTANHEFFGLAVAEAIAAGAFPLLPKRQSYPRLLDLDANSEREACFYQATPRQLATMILGLRDQPNLNEIRCRLTDEFRQKFSWLSRAMELDLAMVEFYQESQRAEFT